MLGRGSVSNRPTDRIGPTQTPNPNTTIVSTPGFQHTERAHGDQRRPLGGWERGLVGGGEYQGREDEPLEGVGYGADEAGDDTEVVHGGGDDWCGGLVGGF